MRHQGQFLVPNILLYWGIASVLISVVEKKEVRFAANLLSII